MLQGSEQKMSAHRRFNNLKNTHEQQGLTLIECLVAIVVIAITVAAVGPMMVFAVATRVQNQKTEQALQLAQSQIDKVRLVVEQGGDYGDRLKGLGLLSSSSPTVAAVGAPNNFIASTASTTDIRQAKKIDFDGDGDDDFAVQMYRNQGVEVLPQTVGVSANTPVVFNIGVRVYDARAENNISSLTTSTAGLTFTSGEGDRGRQPLAVLYGQIAQGDRDGGLCQYWEFAGSSPTTLLCN